MRIGAKYDGATERVGALLNKVPIPVGLSMFGMPTARAVQAGQRLGIFRELAAGPATAAELAQKLGLRDEGTRRLLEVARALTARPALLLLDEPASGLDVEDVRRLGRLIRASAAAGATVIVIEHNFQMMLEVADVINVLRAGRLIATGPPAEIRTNRAVMESYLGEPVEIAP